MQPLCVYKAEETDLHAFMRQQALIVKFCFQRSYGDLLVCEESKERREHSAEAADSERHRHLLNGGVTSRQQVRVDRELHVTIETLCMHM